MDFLITALVRSEAQYESWSAAQIKSRSRSPRAVLTRYLPVGGGMPSAIPNAPAPATQTITSRRCLRRPVPLLDGQDALHPRHKVGRERAEEGIVSGDGRGVELNLARLAGPEQVDFREDFVLERVRDVAGRLGIGGRP